jgi:RNA polymerase sigma factor (sigma-70 family)
MRNHSPTDPELLAVWLEHRRETAFRELVARYAGLVYATARRTSRDESLAAEVSQLTFITLARKARSLTSCASLGGWLHRTAMMHAKNLRRRTQRENRKLELLAMETQSPSAGDTWKDMQPVLDDALASLSENDREALLLRFYRAFSVQEVAATLGIATDAAQKRIDRATARLRDKLTRRGVQTGGSLGTAMLAGFAADAQAAPPISMLASKAMAAGTGASIGGLTALFNTITTLMKTSSWIPPAAALLVAGVWTGTKYHSLATIEAENDRLREQVFLAQTSRTSIPTKTRNEDAPLDWQKLATEPDNGPEKQRLIKRLETTSREELIAMLDQFATFDCPKGRKTVLEAAVIMPLMRLDPEWVLGHYATRLHEKELRLDWALANWARKDMAAATAWLDSQIAAGRLDGKSLDESRGYGPRVGFESALIALLIDSDAPAAGRRLGALPVAQRESVISSLTNMMCNRLLNERLTDGNHLVFANLVRSQMPTDRQTRTLASCLSYVWGVDEFPKFNAYMDVIEATPDERVSCAEHFSGNYIRMLSNKRKVTLDDLNKLRERFAEISPDGVESMTAGSLAKAMNGRNASMMFPQASALAVELMESTGNDEVLAGFLEIAAFDEPDKPLGRELATKVRDEQRRVAILDRFK